MFFPETSEAALHQHARDIGGALNVLCIAMQPGYEDLASLAYLRMAKGANIMTAYVTNGEAGESDVRSEYPAALAAVRREEAVYAMATIDGNARFMNFPDIAAAHDTLGVRAFLPSDSVQQRLRIIIEDFKPDLILIARDFGFAGSTLRSDLVVRDVRQSVRRAAMDGSWTVTRIAEETSGAKGISFPVRETHPFLKMSYSAIADTAAAFYASLSVQRASWRRSGAAYRVVHSAGFVQSALDAGLIARVPFRFRGLETGIRNLSRDALLARNRDPGRLLKPLTSFLDSIEFSLAHLHLLNAAERRLLLRWKAGLDGIRNTLLGVRVEFSVSDTILTNRQLTYLTVTEVHGRSEKGVTEMYIPALSKGWILNEDINRKLPLEIDKDYRLLSPETLTYDYPRTEDGLFQSTLRAPMYFFIIHKAEDRTRSFTYRGSLHFSFAPKFTVEVLTPIVRAMQGESVIVRLTNHSRDGVRDSIYVRDSLASAPRRLFRLNDKGAVHVDTLSVRWAPSLAEGSHIINVVIDEIPVARFVARQFAIAHDSSRRVAIIPGVSASPTLDALRRISQNAKVLYPGNVTRAALEHTDVLLVDRRVLTLYPALRKTFTGVEEFVKRGGHLVVLAQESDALADISLLKSIRATRTFRFGEGTNITFDTTHSFLRFPNKITRESFDDWVFRKAYNALALPTQHAYEVPVRVAGSGEPLMVTWKLGSGRITYIDLALQTQWLNVHAGALRLLANVVSMR